MQPRPTYPAMTTVQSREILEHLTTKYGSPNVGWPVIFYDSGRLQPLWLTFEVNNKNSTNRGISGRFFQEGQLPEYFINYLDAGRQIVPLTGQPWPDPPGEEIIKNEYSSTYDYAMSRVNRAFNTIDIDYVWRAGERRHLGLELTTFFVRMDNVNTARRLVEKFIERRAAVRNAHQFRMLARVAEMQRISLSLVFVNVRGKGNNEILTEGNVFVVPIDSNTAEGLHQGRFPADYRFLSWQEWLSSL